MSDAPPENLEQQDNIDMFLYVLGTHRSSTGILYIDVGIWTSKIIRVG